jgi:hypothetical protein
MYFVLKIPIITDDAGRGVVGHVANRRPRPAERADGHALVRREPLADRRLLIVAAVLISLPRSPEQYVVPAPHCRRNTIDKVQIKNKKFRGHFNSGDLVPRSGQLTNINRSTPIATRSMD